MPPRACGWSDKALVSANDRIVEQLSFDYSRSNDDVGELRAAMTSVVKQFFGAIEIQTTGVVPVTLRPEEWHFMQVLKSFARGFVLSSPLVGMSERSEERAIQITFRGLERWIHESEKAGHGRLPEPLESFLPPSGELRVRTLVRDGAETIPTLTSESRRAIADYLCTLTDGQCRALARWMAGVDTPGVGALI